MQKKVEVCPPAMPQTKQTVKCAVSNSLRLISSTFLLLSLVACAHSGFRSNTDEPTATKTGRIDNGSAPTSEASAATGSDLNDLGSDLNDIPLAVNRQVFQWIDYFQGRGRPHMERYLSRSTRYMPLMKEILKREGLPEELIYIALIESGFSSTAHSSASAVGYWQFIRGTGSRYGLQIDSYVDERRDFVKSTQAAADYFKGLYSLFGNWYLAIASYNVGENRVKNLIAKNHTRDFWQLARENKLPDETINYVPKFLAARLIAREPEKYGFTDIEYMPPLEFSEVELSHGVDIRKLAKEMNVEYDDLRDLNPSYKRGVAFLKGGALKLRVPKGTEAQAIAMAPAAVAGSRATYVADEDYGYYRVRRGDSIASIAKKFGASQRLILELNNFRRGTKLVAGRRLRVPAETVEGPGSRSRPRGEAGADNRIQVASAKKNFRVPQSQKETPKFHIVKKGDTLIEIAKKYQVSIRKLASHNQLHRRAKIQVGARLEIP